jgi:signal transduction histidine kinase
MTAPALTPRAAPRGNGSLGGFGLTAMRERVARLAGTLALESAPGAGTTLAVSIPLIPVEGQP